MEIKVHHRKIKRLHLFAQLSQQPVRLIPAYCSLHTMSWFLLQCPVLCSMRTHARVHTHTGTHTQESLFDAV